VGAKPVRRPPPVARPRCCKLAAANLAWFPRSGPAGAWHAVSFGFDPARDAPPTDAYHDCPFCGAPLGAGGAGEAGA